MSKESELEERLRKNIQCKKENIEEDKKEVKKMTKELLHSNIKNAKSIIDKLDEMDSEYYKNRKSTQSKVDKLVDDINYAIKGHYESVNHPQHYNNYDMEVIDMMEKIWGVESTITFCEMNAFKYRMRMGTKPGQSLEQDLEKEKWYLNKAKELKLKLSNN